MIVRLSDEAERDPEEIGDHIAADNPQRAFTFVGELRASCLGLADFSRRFPLVPRYEKYGIRRRVHGDYLIFYHANEEEVIVIHILHGASHYADLL